MNRLKIVAVACDGKSDGKQNKVTYSLLYMFKI